MKKTLIIILLLVLFAPAVAQDTPAASEEKADTNPGTMPTVPDVIDVIDKATAKDTETGEQPEWTTPIKLVVIFTLLAIIPSLLAMTTSFTRIVIVLNFARQALGTQQIPPTTALMGLAIFLTVFTMAPTFYEINLQAIQPYLNDEIDFTEMSETASGLMKTFMLNQTRPQDLKVFVKMSKIQPPKTLDQLPLHVVIPSFIISEFRTAFEIGCLMFVPFLLLDLVIASVLLSAGMMMLPPVMISLPFKLILFILIDGWGILAHSLSLSFK